LPGPQYTAGTIEIFTINIKNPSNGEKDGLRKRRGKTVV
jgi:hypothetical protein